MRLKKYSSPTLNISIGNNEKKIEWSTNLSNKLLSLGCHILDTFVQGMISTKNSKAYHLSILMKDLFISPGVLQKAFLYRLCIYNLIAKMCAGKDKKPTKLIVKLTTKTHRKPKKQSNFWSKVAIAQCIRKK